MTTVHQRYIGLLNYNGDAPEPLQLENTRRMTTPGNTSFLYRTRMFIEFRIAAYSQTDSQEPPGEFWDDMHGFVGVWYDPGPSIPGNSDDPIGGVGSDKWVQWEMLTGDLESVIVTQNNWHRYTYAFRLAGGISESFAKRKPDPTPGGTQSTWLAWNFFDGNSFINRAHGSFDVVYDLQVKWAVDHFFQLY